MSTPTDLLHDLLAQGVELSIEDGKLRVRAPDGVLPPERLETLRRYKEELLRLLPEYRFEAPLSAGQEGLWYIQKSDPDSVPYNASIALRVESEGDTGPALRRALQRLVNRHASLRTTYAVVDGGPRQIIHAHRALDLVEIDADGWSPADLLSAVAAIHQRPFDLEAEGVLRARLFRHGRRESVLLLCMHHIAFDGWSLRMLFDELLRLYAADGKANPLPPVTRSYQHFVGWQRDRLAARGEELRRAWMDELEGAPLILDLPTDRARPPVQTFRGEVRPIPLAAPLSDALRALARDQGTTLYALFLSAFQVLLHRYSGQEDFCVGSVAALRMHEELESTFGYMINLIVLRAQISAGAPPDFQTLLQQTHRRLLTALDRADYPFPWLVKDLLTQRDPGRPPVVQAVLDYQRAQSVGDAALGLMNGATVEVGGARFSQVPLPQLTSELELSLQVNDRPEKLDLALRYNSDLFDARSIDRMAGHLVTLLEAIVAEPGRPVTQLPLLTEAEREEQIVAWNRTEAPFSSEACIHELFEAQVDRTPDAIAIVDFCGGNAGGRGAPITYRELDRRANQVAHRLRRLGVGPEVLVGLCMERSTDLIVGLLGILKAGGAFTVLDPEHPRRRLSFILEDTGVPVVLTQASLRSSLPETRAHVVDFDAGFEGEPEQRPRSGVGPKNLVYVLYTSGSTGAPNGAMIEHRGLCNVVEATIPLMGIDQSSRLAHVTAFNFDGATGPLFWMLIVGGTVCLAPRDGNYLGKGLVELMEREATTHIFLVPAMLATLPEAELPSMKGLAIGGERVSEELVARWGRGGRFVCIYGPTETTVFATAAPRCAADGRDPPIGRPLNNYQAYILDRWLQPVPAGVVGELYLGGVGVGRGYLNRPELTAQKFIQNPFGEGRLYRTGDMVRYRMTDGVPPTIDFVGRVDGQVKISGYRIELSEVERALRATPRVRDAVVTIHEGAEGDVATRRLVAYVTPAGQEPLDEQQLVADLNRELREALPHYLVPSAIMVLPALPLNINGKVDVRALPPPQAMAEGASELTEPRTDVERKLAEVWKGVLGLDRIGVHQDFFHLGGHSLMAVQVMSRVPSVFGVELPVRALFEMPTIEALARHLEGLQGHDTELDHDLRAMPHPGTLPVSPAQRGLWFLSQLEGAQVAYNMPFVTELRGALDTGALSRGIEEMVRRHESLRTTFRLEAEGPVQVIHPPAPLHIPLEDLSGLTAAAREAAMERLIDREVHWAFDMERGPLLRARIVRVSPTCHLLCLVIHHIVGDGWSMGIFVQELAVLYGAFVAGRPSPLPEPKLQYADFSRWQEARFAGGEGERQLAYWKQKLADLQPLRLPTDRPRPSVESFRGDHHVFRIDPELTRSLQALSREEGVTLYVTLLAAFDVLLARYSGQDDIAVASVTANRKRPALEALIGFFVNTLVVRSDLSDNPTFRELLRRVHTSVMEAFEHEDLPFERVVEELRPERTAGHNPLAQVALTLQNLAETRLTLPGLEASPRLLPFRTSKFDLMLLITDADGGLQVVFEYNSDLFERRTVERMAAHLEAILGEVARDRGRPIGEILMLSEAEREEQIVAWNRTEAPFSSEACIHELFEAQVDRTPDAIAIVDFCGGNAGGRGAPITYRELDRRANQVAHRLRRLDVGPDVLVGLCMERSTDLIVGLLGILKAGGAFTVLDPEHPRRRLAFMMEDTGAPVVLTQASLRSLLPETRARVVDFDEGFEGEPEDRPRSGVGPTNLVYVLYTSGSTGAPNGAMIEHRGLCNLVESTLPIMGIDHGSRLAHVTAFNFDGATGPLFWALTAGGAVYLAPRDGDHLGKGLVDRMEREAITHIFLVPAMLSALPEAALPSLRGIALGGERVSAELVARWGQGGRIVNGYGPTETTVFATMARCVADGRDPPIGRPLPNYQAYILDRWGQPAPAGVVGELYLGGVGVGRGYLNRPELTAQKFIQNPFGEGRLYRTGDMVRYRMTDGVPPVIDFVGRVDTQVKINGHRIELSEVERALRASPRVRDAVVTVHEGADGQATRRLVAYVTPASRESLNEQELTADLDRELREALPHYLVPSAIMVLPALPLNINGKVDVRALPPPQAMAEGASELTEPRTDTERKLAEVWKGVLGLDRIGVHQDFFHLGGHSLMAVQVMSRVPSVFGVELPVRALFEMPTIEALARHLEGLQGHDPGLDHDLRAMPHPGTLPVSPAQRRLWFLSQLEGAQVAYNMPFITELRGALDTGALSRSIEEIVRRHESLRTTFRLEAEGPVQVIHPPAPLHIPLEDLSGLTAAAREAAIERLIDREVHWAFDMERGPLLRARIVRVSPTCHLLCLVIHHIVGDGWSMGVFVQELAALYGAFVAGRPSPLPEPKLQYADFSRWQEARFAGGEGERLLAYWRRKLADLQPLRLPTDRPRPSVESFRGDHHVFRIDPELTRSLQALSREEGVTLYVTLLAAFDVLLARHSGQDDIAVASGTANRKHPALEALIGFFVNTLVVRSDLSDNPTFRALLQRVHTSVMEAFEHEDLPFERVVEELRPERTAGHNPLAQVALTLQSFADTRLTLPGLEASPRLLPFRTSKFDLMLLITEADGGLHVIFEYNSDLFERPTVERMAARFEAILGEVVRDRGRPMGDIPLLTEAEREQLLVAWNRTEARSSSEACIHQLFEAHADRTPDAIALVDRCGRAAEGPVGRGAALTYRELDRRANQVAHRLVRLGVRPETRVGLCLERSADLIVGLLGILKAGGAVVVLDPEHPRPRLSFLLEDTGVPVLLTRASLLSSLPETRARVVDYDQGFRDEPAHRPESGVGPQHLAYVLYTSGTTGQPNGALIEHRGLVNSIEAHIHVMETGPGARLAHVLSFNFDAAMAHLFDTICAGAALYLAPRDGDFLSSGFIDLMERDAITHTAVVPSMLAALPDAALPSLRTLVVGGEKCSAELVARWGRTRRMINVYGPTEASILATSARCIPDGNPPPIGRPIANMRAYVVDRWGQLAPPGVVGELYLGGVGVARGYLNRPELTARKFIDNPFGEGRLYRTGDLVRYRVADDAPPALEFIGRLDSQVKVRGHRVELSEVESALRASPRVRGAVATVQEAGDGASARLVAYVTPARRERSREWELERIASWDKLNARIVDEEPSERELTLDIKGWKSSYTGEDIPAEEMRAWAESTVARILDLAPREVLEIGCGTGMLLARIAPRARRYRGTDLSRHAIRHVELLKAKLGGLDNVHVSQQPAHDLAGLAGERFDTVILNSVVQYFPSADYLLGVIEGILGLVPEGGAIFIGDVRNLALLEAYHASVERFRAGSPLSRRELRARVQRALIEENELVLHPHFFTALRARFPQIVDVEIAPKRGAYKNELSAFRYDVTLRVGAAPPSPAPAPIEWLDVGVEGLTLDDLRARIARSAPGRTLGLRGIPNARLHEENALLGWLHGDDEGRPEPRRPPGPEPRAWDPEALHALSDELPCQVSLSWAAARPDGSLDAIVTTGDHAPAPRFPLDPPAAPASWADLANDPLQSTAYRELAMELRRELSEALPQHLVPSAIVVLPALPLTLNGKVDLRALPAPSAGAAASAHGAPRSEVERKLTEVWREVLGLDHVGIHDNFFDLGGHSLLAMTVMARVEAELGRRISVSALFQAPTIEELARRITGPVADALLTPIQPAGDRPPLFWIPGFGVHIVYLHALGKRLGQDQPLFGIQPLDIEAEMPDVEHMEVLAARIADAIQKVQPAGPYTLGGHSAGAVIVLAVVLELEARGHQTTLVVVDVKAPPLGSSGSTTRDASILDYVRNMRIYLGDQMNLDMAALERLPGEEAWQYVADRFQRMKFLPPGSGVELLQRLVRPNQGIERVVYDYTPGVQYQGRLVVLKAADADEGGHRWSTEGWQELCARPVTTFTVPGNHVTVILEPHVGVVVEHLRRLIDEGDGRAS